jgi:ribosomal protein S18 acetylase RimI-like enzyme
VGGGESSKSVAVPIRPMTGEDYEEVIAISARAFWYDPLVDFFSRDMLHEYRLLPAVFKVYLRDLMRPHAELWIGENGGRPRAVAGWLAPGRYPRPLLQEVGRTVHSAAVLTRGRHRLKAFRLFLEVDRHHPQEPHWYLVLLATDPTVQGRGMGSALLAPILDRCDQDGTVAYTETQKESNVSWYARAGFAVTHEIRLPDTPTVWCLQREPRP